MAPEQLRGEAVDARADIWALGCLLQEMLTAQDLRVRRTIRPTALRRVIDRCLADQPQNRWDSASVVADRLQAIRKRPRLHASAAILTIALIATGGAFFALHNRSRIETPSPAAHAPVSLVIADFENRTGDPVFDGALEHVVAIGLESASFVRVLPRRDAILAAQTIEADAKLDANTARLVAQREGVGAVVAGVIDSAPTG